MAVYRYGKKTSDINVQSDFNIKDTKSDAFIKNRPDSTLSIALDGVEQKKHYNPNTGSETINIDLSDTIIAQDNKLNNAIASLEVSRIGGSGKYISDVSEKDGKISATAVSTASTFSSTSTTAINGVGVNEALKTLDVAEVGEVGRYIEKIKETDGKISATLAVMDTTPTKDSKKAVTSSGVKAYIDDKISNLDVASVGGDGKYISAISETDGKITATVTSTNSTFSSTSTTAINGVGVNEALKTLDVAEVGSNGKYIQKIKEDNGKISATLKSFDTIISDESTDDNVPTSKAVNTKIFSEINKLNVNEVGEEGKYIEKILENSGKISTVVKTMDTAPTANSKKPVTSGGVKSYVDIQVNTEKTNRETAIAALDSTSTLTAGNYYTGMTETNGIVTLSQSAMDTIPTANSKKPVTSGGVKSYVDSLNKSLVGEDGSYIKTISESKGIITATKQTFDTSITSTSTDTNAPTSKAVYNAIQSLGNVFHVRDSVETFSKLPSTGNTAGDVRNVNDTDDNYVWTGTKWDPLGGSSLINTLNYSSPTASGTNTSFITSVSQSKGLITASKSNLPTASTSVVGIVKLNDAVNSTSTTTAATANAVKKVQDSVNTEVTNRTTAVSNVQSALTTEIADRKSAITTEVTNRNTAISTAINALNKTSVGADGSYIKTISESKGIITATKQTFDTTISSDSTDNNTPTSKAVKDYVDSEISNLNTDLTTAINGKQASGNYKTTQTAVSSPAASGNATAFIDTISQNANGVITVTKKNVPSATQSVAGLMSAADKTKLDGLATHTTLSKTSTLSGMTKDEVYYINTTGITTTVSAITNMGIKLTFVTNVATTIKYYNTSGTLTTKSMDAGTVFFLFSCGSGYTPNLYGTVLDINPSSTSVGQIYIKTK